MALNSDEYYSIEAPSQGLYKDQKSKFYAFAYPVESEGEVKVLLERLREEYHDARHHCCAYRIGLNGQEWRASDDGEPAGTAGRPILGQIDSAGLSDVAVIVVRYFGGIKLGALSHAKKIVKVEGRWCHLSFDYSQIPSVMKILKDMALPIRAQEFGSECSMDVRLRSSLMSNFFDRIKNLPNFKYEFI